MEKKWNNSQSVIVISIIVVIFLYILFDAFMNKPHMRKDINDIKMEYTELSKFLDEKIPEIDSTFKDHAIQLQEQKEQMDTLQITLAKKIK